MSTLLKKSLISTTFVFLSAGVMADEISNDTIYLKWGGVAPKSSDTGTASCIIKLNVGENNIAHNAGELIFADNPKDNKKVDITSSTEFGFTVVARNPSTGVCDEEKVPFTYTLKKFGVEIYGKDLDFIGGSQNDGVIEKPVDEKELGKWRLKYSQVWDSGNGGATTTRGDLTSVIYDPQEMPLGGNVNLWVEGGELGVDVGDMARVQAYVLIEPGAVGKEH